ncbi:MAG: prepilin-type N-terminal cleavage/methylation domain-containing protein [Gemmatimonadota bacterium]|jgi:type II secretion system protein G
MRDKKGFTLIELLIVVVIIGILAAIAIPKFASTREKAYFSSMKADLKNLASQQEIYYSDHFTYSSSLTDLGFVATDGITIVTAGDAEGWNANAVHDGIPNDGCNLYYGSGANAVATGSGGASQAGEIACTDG